MKTMILPFIALTSLTFANDVSRTPMSSEMSDGHIAQILITANEGEIDAAKLAKSKAKDPKVKNMAEMMIRDHGESKKALKEWLKSSKTKKKESVESKALATGAKDTKKKLKGLKNEQFDAAYVDAQVAGHEKVLSTLDGTLMPSVQNAELKALLEKMRPVIAGHLQHAKELQSSKASD